jgi:hypothetical protein
MRDFKGMKRQRGRNRGGGGGGKPQQHNANRAFESNGPDNLKIRGHAQHVYEKYQQLARDAASAGDRVLAENFLQHAEHYFRVLRTLQPNRPYTDFIGREGLASGYDIDFEEDGGGYGEEGDAAADGGDQQSSDDRGDYQPRDGRWDNRNGDGRNGDGRNGESRNGDGRNGEGRDQPRADARPDNRSDNRPDTRQDGARNDRNFNGRNRDRNFNRNDGRWENREGREDRSFNRDQPRDANRDQPRDRNEGQGRWEARGERPERAEGSEGENGRYERRSRYEGRDESARDPLAVVEPQAAPLVSREPSPAPESRVLRSRDGEESQAPAFLQATPAPAAAEDAPAKRPRGRPRKKTEDVAPEEA